MSKKVRNHSPLFHFGFIANTEVISDVLIIYSVSPQYIQQFFRVQIVISNIYSLIYLNVRPYRQTNSRKAKKKKILGFRNF